MRRAVMQLIALGLIGSFFLPIPGGFIYLALGLSILICSSLPFALFVQGCRRRFLWANRALTRLEDKLGDKWAKNLKVTRPDVDLKAFWTKKAIEP